MASKKYGTVADPEGVPADPEEAEYLATTQATFEAAATAASPELAGLTMKDLIAALKAFKGDDNETLARRAKYEAEAHDRLQNWENKVHPGISVYSYPEGDRAHPKPPLKCEMFWVGYPLDVEGCTPEEVELLNQVQPGEYLSTKTDGSIQKVTIAGTRGLDGKLEKLELHFPCRGDNKHNQPSMSAMLREILGKQSQVSEMQQELDQLRAVVSSLAGR